MSHQNQVPTLLLLWSLLLFTACQTSATPTVILQPAKTPATQAQATSTPSPTPTPTVALSSAVSPVIVPTETLPPPIATPIVKLSSRVAHISGSPYAVVEIEPLVPPQCCPTLSPNGQKVAFGNPSGTETKIFVQNSDGSDLKTNGWGASGLSVVDVSNPARPVEVSFIPAAQQWGSVVDVAARPVPDGVNVYLANRFEGLLVYPDVP